MADDADIATFLKLATLYANIEVIDEDWEGEFARAVDGIGAGEVQESFRRGFAKSLAGGLTPAEYERRTRWDFDTPEELHTHLLQLWRRFYGDTDPG
jgi:hypothetical protein